MNLLPYLSLFDIDSLLFMNHLSSISFLVILFNKNLFPYTLTLSNKLFCKLTRLTRHLDLFRLATYPHLHSDFVFERFKVIPTATSFSAINTSQPPSTPPPCTIEATQRVTRELKTCFCKVLINIFLDCTTPFPIENYLEDSHTDPSIRKHLGIYLYFIYTQSLFEIQG